MHKKEQETPAVKVEEKKPSRLAVSLVQRLILAVVLGLIVTALSAFIPIRIENAAALNNLRFGFPFPFVLQRYYGVLYEDCFPGSAPPQFHADACYTTLSAGNFFLSAGINAAVIAAVLIGIFLLRRRIHTAKEPLPEI